MQKILFLLLCGICLYLFLRRHKQQDSGRKDTAAAPDPVSGNGAERMVACAQCGVHVPEGESLPGGGWHYCCEPHRELGPRTGKR